MKNLLENYLRPSANKSEAERELEHHQLLLNRFFSDMYTELIGPGLMAVRRKLLSQGVQVHGLLPIMVQGRFQQHVGLRYADTTRVVSLAITAIDKITLRFCGRQDDREARPGTTFELKFAGARSEDVSAIITRIALAFRNWI